MDKNSFWSAVIGGVFVLLGAWLAWWWRNESEKERIKFTLIALNTEAECLLEVTKDILDNIRKRNINGEAFTWFLKSNQNYFSTYERNADIIGKIKDDEYRKNIIKHYLLAKRFLDALLTNTFFYEKSLENASLFAKTNHKYFLDISEAFDKIMTDEVAHLNEMINDIEKNISSYHENHKRYIDNNFYTIWQKIIAWL